MPLTPFDFLASLPERCLVGVSGGIDSVVLLHALVAAGKRPVVVHFDHGWRAESVQDAVFVRQLAAEMKLKCLVGRASRSLKKTEQAARTARWDFFAKAAKQSRCHDLILAHNADDQVETFLLQLLRGGGSGVRGMRGKSTREKLTVHRPWLGVWRREILALARENKWTWREDSTNRDTALRRNRVRHRLVPYLKKHFSADAPQALWRAAEILGAESEWLDALVSSSGSDIKTERLAVKVLRGLPLAQQRRLLRTWLHARGIADLNFDHIEAVRGLIENRFPAKVNLPQNHHACRRSGSLFVI